MKRHNSLFEFPGINDFRAFKLTEQDCSERGIDYCGKLELRGGGILIKTVLFFILFIFSFTSSVQALSWAYSFAVWNGNVYEVTEENVLESEIGKVIGEVKTKPNEMTGNYYGNASNSYPKGTKYYEIKGTSTESAIAVEVEEKQWVKAVYVHEAPFHWMDLVTKVLPFLILIAIVVFIISRMKKAGTKDTL